MAMFVNTRSIPKKQSFVISIAVFFMLPGCQTSQAPASSPYTIVYSSSESGRRQIYLSDDEGASRFQVTDFTGSDGYPAVSPDGKSIAFYGKYDDRNTWSIHTVNVDGTNVHRLTHVKNVWDSAPAWSPDGKTIVFAREYRDSQDQWQEEVWLMNADGSDQRQIEALEGRAPYFLQDGRILFHSKTGPSQICIADVDGKNLIQLTHNDANDWSPKVSPDGTQIAFISNRDGNQQVYTMNVDGTNQQRITFSDLTDWGPAWSRDGNMLFFNSQDSDGASDLYKINKDGSSMVKIIAGGSQVASIKSLDIGSLEN